MEPASITLAPNAARRVAAIAAGVATFVLVRLVRLPLATRLVLTTPRPPFKAVHAGTPELIAAFEEVARLVRPRPRS